MQKDLKIIYDFGANSGINIPYYLMRADLIVAVEANPALGRRIARRFAREIRDGRVVLVNKVVSTQGAVETQDFYIHRGMSTLSQLPTPGLGAIEKFEKVSLPCISPAAVIEAYGEPYYVKIDLEHYDHVVLQSLHESRIYPPYISAEAHHMETFDVLRAMGYSRFKLLNGAGVPRRYKNRTLNVGDHEVVYSFPRHSAGPFGDDIDGRWITAGRLATRLEKRGLGWKDIHATGRQTED